MDVAETNHRGSLGDLKNADFEQKICLDEKTTHDTASRLGEICILAVRHREVQATYCV